MAVDKMLHTNHLKFDSCVHVKQALLNSKVVLAEATTNPFWGSGLLPKLTKHTLSDYWPGKNNMGKILVQLREDISNESMSKQSAHSDKWKASSPLNNTTKFLKI